jgi:2-aminobenzoate-CoA ligase
MTNIRERTLSNSKTPSAPDIVAPEFCAPSAHVDAFAREHLPPKELWPEMKAIGIPDLDYPASLNAAVELLDRHVESGSGASPCLRTDNDVWSYQKLLQCSNRIANLLVSHGLVPGERVLLRDANSPMLAACWFAVIKAGGIAVTTMSQIRAQELVAIVTKARIKYALCKQDLSEELVRAQGLVPALEEIIIFENWRAQSDRAFSSRLAGRL